MNSTKFLNTTAAANNLKDFHSSIKRVNKLFITNEKIGIDDVTLEHSTQHEKFNFGLIGLSCFSTIGVKLMSYNPTNHEKTKESKK